MKHRNAAIRLLSPLARPFVRMILVLSGLAFSLAVQANTPPTITLTSPANGATYQLGEVVPLRATVVDAEGNYNNVSFYVNGSPYTDWSGPPWAVNWTANAGGTKTIYAKARDTDNAQGTSITITINVESPNQPPTVSLTAPANGASYTTGTTIALRANASDPDGNLSGVSFYVDGKMVGNDGTSPFSASYYVQSGNHTAYARAIDSENYAANSATISFSGGTPPPPPPPTPASITVPTHNVNFDTFTVSWSASTGATNYSLEQSANGAGWTYIGGGVATSRQVTVPVSGSYQYRVRANNASGNSGYVTSSVVTVNLPTLAPATLIAPAVGSAVYYGVTGNCFDWAPVTGATHYNLQVGLAPDLLASKWVRQDITQTSACWSNGAGFVAHGSPAHPVSAYKGSGARYWRVRAINGPSGTDTAFSLSTTNAYTLVDAAPPPAPTSITVPITNVNFTTFDVSWDISEGADSYELEESVNGGTWASIPDIGSATTWQKTNATDDTSYRYRVRAVSTAGASAYTTSTEVTINLPGLAPADLTSPTGGVSVYYGETGNCFNWSPVTGATHYNLQVGLGPDLLASKWVRQDVTQTSACWDDGAGFVNQGSPQPPVSDYGDGGIRYWRVRAINAPSGSDTEFSLSATASFSLARPQAPTSITAPVTVMNHITFNVSWGTSAGATGYVLEGSSDGGANWQVVFDGAETNTDVTVPGTGDYLYRVRARDGAGSSAPTAPVPVAVNLLTLAPAVLVAPGADEILLYGTSGNCFSWEQVPGAERYNVQVGTDPDMEVTKWMKSDHFGLSACWNNGVGWDSYGSQELPVTAYQDQELLYWRIRALKGEFGVQGYESSLSESWPFRLASLTAPGSITVPDYNVNYTEFNVSWSSTPEATSYRLEVSGDDGNTWSLEYEGSDTSVQVSVPGADDYLYRVMARDGSATSMPTESDIVTVNLPTLDPVVLVSPAIGEIVHYGEAGNCFSWQAVPGLDIRYNVQVWETDGPVVQEVPKWVLENVSGTSACWNDGAGWITSDGANMPTSDYPGEGTRYWRVRALKGTYGQSGFQFSLSPTNSYTLTLQEPLHYSYHFIDEIHEGDAPNVYALIDGTRVRHGQGEWVVNAGATVPVEVVSQGSVIESSKPLSIGSNRDGADMPVPLEFAGTDFSMRRESDQSWYYVKSLGETATTFRFFNGTTETIETVQPGEVLKLVADPVASAAVIPGPDPQAITDASQLDFAGDFVYALDFYGSSSLVIGDAVFTNVSNTGSGAPAGVSLAGFGYQHLWPSYNLGTGADNDALEILFRTIIYGYQTPLGVVDLPIEPGARYRLQLLSSEAWTGGASRHFDLAVEPPLFQAEIAGATYGGAVWKYSTGQGYAWVIDFVASDANLDIDMGPHAPGNTAYILAGLTLERLPDEEATTYITDASAPLLVSHRSAVGGDAYPVAPVSSELIGIKSASANVVAGGTGAQVNAYVSDGSAASYPLATRAGANLVGTMGEQGTGDAIRLISDLPMSAVSIDDGDGNEQIGFWPLSMMANRYVLPVDTQYAAIACLGTDPVFIEAKNAAGDTIASAECLPAEPNPGKAYLGSTSSGVHLQQGTQIIASAPVYLYYEATATNDEHNLAGAFLRGSVNVPTYNVNTNTFDVSWGMVPGATDYHLEVSDDDGVTWTEVYAGTATSAQVLVATSGTYLYQVYANTPHGQTAPVRSNEVTVKLPTLDPVPVLSPAEGDLVWYGDTGNCFSWETVAGASHYNLQVALTPDFIDSKWVKQDITPASPTDTTVTACWNAGMGFVPQANGGDALPLSDYAGEGARYWRVRAINAPSGSDTEFSLSAIASYTLTLIEPLDYGYHFLDEIYAGDTPNVYALVDDTRVRVGGLEYLADSGEQVLIGAVTQGTVVESSQPLSIGSNRDGADMPVPVKFAGTNFAMPQLRDELRYYVKPLGDSAVTFNYFNGVAETIEAVSPGEILTLVSAPGPYEPIVPGSSPLIFTDASQLDFAGEFEYALNFNSPSAVTVGDAAFSPILSNLSGLPAGVIVSNFSWWHSWSAFNLGVGPDNDALETVLQGIQHAYNNQWAHIRMPVEPGVRYRLQLLFSEGAGTGVNTRNFFVSVENTILSKLVQGTAFPGGVVTPSSSQGYAWVVDFEATDARIDIDFGYGNSGMGTVTIAGLTLERLPNSVTRGPATITAASAPLLVSQRSDQNGDAHPVPPLSADLLGIKAGEARVVAGDTGAQVDAYASDASTLSYNLLPGESADIVGTAGAQGVGSAVRLLSTMPISAVAHDDGDGNEQTAFWPTLMLGNRYVVPVDAQYVAMACTGTEPVNIELFAPGGAAAGSAICAPGGLSPGKAYFGSTVNGVHITAGSRIEAAKPIYVTYEASASSDEHNLDGALVGDPIVVPTDTVTGNQFTVSWDAVPGATGYQLEASDDGGLTWAEVYSGTETVFEVSVEASGSYTYKVLASTPQGAVVAASEATVIVDLPDTTVTVPEPPEANPNYMESSVSDRVGAIPGDFSVSPRGDAVYSIPFYAPPGTAGVTPQIGLQYTSGGGNGIAGKGASLTGLSSIARCRQTLAIDGNVEPISFSASDRFCLDGQRLIQVDGTLIEGEYVLDETAVFRTEIDSYRLITVQGLNTASGNPDYFKVEAKDGSVSYYGLDDEGNDARHKAYESDSFTASDKVVGWRLARFEDSAGNAIRYGYDTARQRLAEIRYAFGGSTEAGARIEFNYTNDRSDPIISYIGGYRVAIRDLLQSVVSYVRVGPAGSGYISVRDYRLDISAPTLAGGYSRLSSLEECSGGTCRSALKTFGWSKASVADAGFGSPSLHTNAITSKYEGGQPADLNGDGYNDLLWVGVDSNDKVKLHAAIYDPVNETLVRPTGAASAHELKNTALKTWRVVDFNGDGSQDVAYIDKSDGMLKVLLTTPGQTAATFAWPSVYDTRQHLGVREANGIAFADFNADGLADVIYEPDNSAVKVRFMRRNPTPESCETDDGWPVGLPCPYVLEDPSNAYTLRLYHPDGHIFTPYRVVDEEFTATDFNGDGRADIVSPVVTLCEPVDEGGQLPIPICGIEEPSAYYAFRTGDVVGNSLEMHAYLETDLGLTGAARPKNLRSADFNGDGLADLLYETASGGNNWHYQINTGSSFTSPQTLGFLQEDDSRTLQFADINRDGYTDIVVTMNVGAGTNASSLEAYYWNQKNNSFNARVEFEPAVTAAANRVHKFFDINADGRADWLDIDYRNNNNNVDLALAAGTSEAHDKVTSINNGFGRVVEINYERLSGTSADFYTRRSDAHHASWSYPDEGPTRDSDKPPTFDVAPAMYLVQRVCSSSPSGIDGGSCDSLLSADDRSVQTYRYEGAKLQGKGRGFLGFGRVEVDDHHSQIRTATEYRQDYPLTGRPRSTTQTYMPTSQTLGQVNNTYGFVGAPAANAPVHNVVLLEAVQQSFDPVGGASLGVTKTIHRESTLDTSAAGWDTWGNLTHTYTLHQASPEAPVYAEVYTENTYGPSPDEVRLGRLIQAEVTHTRPDSPAPSVTRKSTFTYYPQSEAGKKGLLQSEQVAVVGTGEKLALVEYDYNLRGNKIRATRTGIAADGGTQNQVRTQEWEYDALDRFVQREYATLNGARTLMREVLDRDTRYGLPSEERDINGVVTKRNYGAFGRPYFEYVNSGDWQRIEYSHSDNECADGARYARTVYTGSGGRALSCFDALDREVTTGTTGFGGGYDRVDVSYNEQGQLTHQTDPYNSGFSVTTITDYDEYGRVRSVTRPGGRKTDYTYAGLMVTISDPERNTRSETRNSKGELESAQDNGGVITYLYDAAGNLRRTAVNAGGEIATDISYDGLGRKVSMNDPDKGIWTYVYNQFGELVRQTNAKGEYTIISYDDAGRRIRRADYSNATPRKILGNTHWYYDSWGQRSHSGQLLYISHDDFNNTEENYRESRGYDSLGRLSWQDTYISGLDNVRQEFTYDKYGRPFQIYGASDIHAGVEYEYNLQGYRSKVLESAVALAGEPQKIWYEVKSVDPRGNQTRLELHTKPGITTVDRTFNDTTGYLEQIYAWQGIETHQDWRFSDYDKVGNFWTAVDASRPTPQTYTYAYDHLYRLKQEVVGTVNRTFSYTLNGNIETFDGSAVYGYGTETEDHPHAVKSIGTTAYTYDANGNMTAGGGRSFDYTVFDKPHAMSNAEGDTAQFSYGPERDRFKQVATVDGKTSTTYYAAGLEVIRTDTGGWEYRRNIDGVAQETIIRDTEKNITGIERQFFLRNHLGSVDAVLAEDGFHSTDMRFEPWGQRRNAQALEQILTFPEDNVGHILQLRNKTHRGFTGHEVLDAFGLIHMNGRVYDAKIGRFLSADPFVQFPTNTQSYNRYSYVLNNPLSFTDPSGYLSFSEAFDIYQSVKQIVTGVARIVESGGMDIGGWKDLYDGVTGLQDTLDGIGGSSVPDYVINNLQQAAPGAAQGAFGNQVAGIGPVSTSTNLPTASGILRDPTVRAIAGLSDLNVSTLKHLNGAVSASFMVALHGAGAADSGQNRVTTTQSVDGQDHRYQVRGLICSTSTEGCDAAYADKVFAHVNQNDVPFSSEDLGSGNKTLIKGIPRPLGNQPIYHSEDISARTSVNITLEGHNFHPGDVTHRVHFENGNLYYDMIGTGSGSYPSFNNWVGIKLFRPGVQDAVDRFGR